MCLILSLVISNFLDPPNEDSSSNLNDFVGIRANICCATISVEHVTNTLKMHGIDASFIVNHRADAFVPRQVLRKAQEIIDADAKTHPWHYFGDTVPLADISSWNQSSTFRTFNVWRANYRDVPEFKRDGNLRGLARTTFALVLDQMKIKASSHPRITSIEIWPMPYLGSDFVTHTGYKATLNVGFDDTTGKFECHAYSWDDGCKTQDDWAGGAIPRPD